MRIEHLLQRAAELYPARVAVEDFQRSLTWSGLLDESTRLARGLVRQGVHAGDRVAILARNRIEYVAAYFACPLASAVLVPLNTRLLPREIAGLLERSTARVLVADASFGAKLGPLPPGCRGFALDAPIEGWGTWADLLTDEGPALSPADAGGDVAVQMYTSGTTGLPKGAMLTHDNVTAVTASWLRELTLGSTDVFLQVTPLFHVGAMLMLTCSVAAGTKFLVIPEFSPAAVARALIQGGVTHTLLVPALIRFFLDHPVAADASYPDLRMLVYGASPIALGDLQRAVDHFRCELLQGYGLTETGGVLTALRPADHRFDPALPAPARLSSAGRPIFGVELRLLGSDGRDVGPGEVGEVVARGPNVFVGYHEMPEATAEAFVDGWFRTGDLATVDADGFVTIVDRSKDMIIVGGENVYPREVEDVLREHPLVADVAVIGVPHVRWGESVLALVVAAGPAPVDDEEGARAVIWHARDRLARFKCPSDVKFVPEIPRNAAGKVLKAALRRPYWANRERQV